MVLKEFIGDVKGISANKLIKKEEVNDLDSFFLVLGLIYNDLKDLLFFLDLFNKTYRQPKLDGSEPVTAHLGHWGGVQGHMSRLMISFMSEFLIFLDKNKMVINSIHFQLLEKGLPVNIKKIGQIF